MNTRQYKRLKGLKKESLRDNMSDMELVLNMLAAVTTTELITNFKEHLILEERNQATVEKYLRDVTAFADSVGGGEISKETVIEYKRNLQEKYKVRSVNSVLASLNLFFGFAGWYELKVKSIKLQKQIYCSEEKEVTKAEYERRLCKAEVLCYSA